MRLGLALHCDGRSRRSSTGRTTSIRTCRRTTRSRQYDQPINVDGWLELPDGTRGRHRAGPPRGGHRQVHPRRRRRPHPRGRATRSSTTTGPACPLLEIVSRPDLRSAEQARAYVSELRADPRRHRRVRRQDGGGLAAGRRQRVGPPARRAASAPAARSRTSTRCARSGRAIEYEAAPPDRAARGGRAGRAGDPPLGRGRRAARRRCARRRRRTTTATSPSPTSCRSCPTTAWQRRGARRRCRRCRPSAGPGWPRPPGPTPAAVALVVERGLDELVLGGHRGRRRRRPGAHPRRAQPGRRGAGRARPPAALRRR